MGTEKIATFAESKWGEKMWHSGMECKLLKFLCRLPSIAIFLTLSGRNILSLVFSIFSEYNAIQAKQVAASMANLIPQQNSAVYVLNTGFSVSIFKWKIHFIHPPTRKILAEYFTSKSHSFLISSFTSLNGRINSLKIFTFPPSISRRVPKWWTSFWVPRTAATIK